MAPFALHHDEKRLPGRGQAKGTLDLCRPWCAHGADPRDDIAQAKARAIGGRTWLDQRDDRAAASE